MSPVPEDFALWPHADPVAAEQHAAAHRAMAVLLNVVESSVGQGGGGLTQQQADALYAVIAHSHSYAALSHSHADGDLPAGLARDSEVATEIATHAATPHGGSDSRLITFTKTADQAVTGTTVIDVSSLSIPVAANSTYLFQMWVDIIASGGTSPTHNYQFTGPAGIDRFMAKRTQMTSATAQATSVVTALATGFGAGATVANIRQLFEGTIKTGGTAGTLQLRVTPAGTNPTSTIGRGSGGYALKVA